jgi:hypothetical protein
MVGPETTGNRNDLAPGGRKVPWICDSRVDPWSALKPPEIEMTLRPAGARSIGWALSHTGIWT